MYYSKQTWTNWKRSSAFNFRTNFQHHLLKVLSSRWPLKQTCFVIVCLYFSIYFIIANNWPGKTFPMRRLPSKNRTDWRHWFPNLTYQGNKNINLACWSLYIVSKQLSETCFLCLVCFLIVFFQSYHNSHAFILQNERIWIWLKWDAGFSRFKRMKDKTIFLIVSFYCFRQIRQFVSFPQAGFRSRLRQILRDRGDKRGKKLQPYFFLRRSWLFV